MLKLIYICFLFSFVSCGISMKPVGNGDDPQGQREERDNDDLTVPFSIDEKEIFNQVNDYRTQNNKRPLKWINQAVLEAQLHSEYMENYNQVNSTGLSRRIYAISVKEDVDIIASGENVGKNTDVESMLKFWKNNLAQRQKLLGDFTHTGVGVVNSGDSKYFTQIFITVR